jgi:hypothetical protein
MRGSVGAIPNREAGSEAVGRALAPEPTLAGRRGPKSWDAWQHWSPPYTTRNTAMGCPLSEAILCELQLKYYQRRFISSCPFQLLGAELSTMILHVEPLLVILSIISSGSRDEPLLII